MTLYHGSLKIIESPSVNYSLKYLDFGAGFYTTSMKLQAERWAKRKAGIHKLEKGYVNIYDAGSFSGYNILTFDNDLEGWLNFVCDCRSGSDIFKRYDLIKGRVADDKVFRVVDMYKRGVWDLSRAILELKVYEMYEQIVFISQNMLDEVLKFRESYEVSIYD